MAGTENSSFSPYKADDTTLWTSTPSANTSRLYVPEGCIEVTFTQYIPWDNENTLVSKRVLVLTRLAVNGLAVPLLMLVCVPANIVNMIVFYKHGLRERINTCLFSLALVDMLFVVSIFGIEIDRLYLFLIGKGDEYGVSINLYFRVIFLGFYGVATASQVITSVIALERCLCVCRPFLAKHFMSTRTTAVFLLCSTSLIVGGYIFVAGLRHNVTCVYDRATNSTSVKLFPSEFYFRNSQAMDFMLGTVYGLFLPVLCITVVTMSTVVTVLKMRSVSKWRDTASSSSSSLSARDLAVTRMIVGTSALFIVCIVPSFTMRASVLVFPDVRFGGRNENVFQVLLRFYELASVVNCTFNFFVYYFYGSRFRETVRQLFSMCHRKTPKAGTSSGNGVSDTVDETLSTD